MRPTVIIWVFIACSLWGCQRHENFLLRFEANEGCGYTNPKGGTIILPDKYLMCFTDTFRTMAVVLDPDVGYVGIDRQERVLFEVFPYDNGPDYLSEGLFRIIKEEKIGYANSQGKIIIKPQFSCAFPFQNGKAKVAFECSEGPDGEHTRWISDDWFYIDKKGKRVK